MLPPTLLLECGQLCFFLGQASLLLFYRLCVIEQIQLMFGAEGFSLIINVLGTPVVWAVVYAITSACALRRSRSRIFILVGNCLLMVTFCSSESDLTITNVSIFVILRGPSPIVTSNGVSLNGHDSSPEKPTRGVLESTRRDLINGFNFRKQCSYITSHELSLSKYALFSSLPDMYTLITTWLDKP
uniref:Uncharacterized protein n=1 Tax=Tanacetum cinerariifolium TaxID=118510 RepID=A0A6L2M3T3_TANCI|nr:hypothetical protein [Tanacetum cinerariifolium]